MNEAAKKIAKLVWSMHQLDPEETIDCLDREQFEQKVLKILKENPRKMEFEIVGNKLDILLDVEIDGNIVDLRYKTDFPFVNKIEAIEAADTIAKTFNAEAVVKSERK